MSPPMNCIVALGQMDPVLGDIRANVEKHVALARQARTAGADLIIFPELSLTGYSLKDLNWDLAIAATRPLPELLPLLEESRNIAIIAGGVEEDSDYRILNSAFLFEDGTMRVVHRKIHPPTYGMFEERRYFSSGDRVRAFDTRLGRFGVLICEDLWHPTLPYLLALDGAQCIITLVASPTRVSGSSSELGIATVNAENHRSYARLLSTYIVFCNRVGFEDGVNFWGGSSIVAPDGSTIAASKNFEEELILARLDGNEIRRARLFSRHFLDDNPQLLLKELQRILSTR
jgi:predicted amidohydrolase